MLTMDSPLAKARKDRNWSQARLILQLRLSGRAAGITLPADSTLRVMLSRWENGQHRPSEMYVGLLCDAFEVTGADLGLAVPHQDQPTSIGLEAVAYLDSMLQLHTRADHTMGSRLVIDVVREQTRQAEKWTHEARGAVHEPLLRTVSRYAEFLLLGTPRPGRLRPGRR